MTDRLDLIELESAPAPTATIVWMHGLGADGHDFVPIVPELALPATLPVRFVFPHAPPRPVSVNGGMVMRAWYDVVEDAGGRRADPAGVRASHRLVEDLIRRETGRGIGPARVLLAGFSQGGAMALHTGLRYPERLGGILALSTFLPLAETVAAEASPPNRDTPIFMAHGSEDAVIPLARGRASRDALLGLGYRVTWREYRMPHAVCPEEIRDVSRWIQDTLASERAARRRPS